MMNLGQAIAYGKAVGAQYYVYNSYGRVVGGTKTMEQAKEMKRRFELDDKKNPWTHGTTRFEIRKINR